MKVFVTGVTGLVGRALADALARRGDTVLGLTRDPEARPQRGVQRVVGDPALRGRWATPVAGCDAVVHLAGETIGGRRWTAARKRLIRDSRIESTRNLVRAIETSPADLRPRVFVVASGADYYPFDDSDRPYAENAPAGDGFLAELCRDWEAEAARAEPLGARVVALRTGVVLARGAVVLQRMAQPFRFGVGGPVGSGRQWFSWVHLSDVVGAYLAALDGAALSGPVNLVAPGATRQRELASALGKALRRPSWLPVPGFAVRLAAGEVARYVLHGRRVVPTALEKAGYAFRVPDVTTALAESL